MHSVFLGSALGFEYVSRWSTCCRPHTSKTLVYISHTISDCFNGHRWRKLDVIYRMWVKELDLLCCFLRHFEGTLLHHHFFFFSPVLHRVWQPCWSAVTVTRGFFCHSVWIFPKNYNWWRSSPVIKSADLCQWNRIATVRTVKESCLSWIAGLTSFFYGTTVW